MVGIAKRVASVVAGLLCLGVLSSQHDLQPWLTATAKDACATNPIVCENDLPGDPDFQVNPAGDSTIEGFAADISVDTGHPVNFKIKASANYEIQIYRLGYYRGAGARRITTLGPFAPDAQSACLTQASTGLVDCGNWNVSATWNSLGAVSGIYLARLVRLDGQGSNHIVFVVRDDTRNAAMLFQTSDTTWQAYNMWGGANLYCGGPISNAGTAYACEGRAAKVSYNRPFDTRAHDPQSFLFNAEYPMVRWLEANGYDVKYWTGVDSDRFGAELSGTHRPSVFLSVGHDEYWSGSQRTHVEQARNNGVNLAFFSGNEVYWKTRWEPSLGTAPVNHRTLVSYKETLRNEINNAPADPLNTGPTPVTTGTWRDTRLGAPGDGGRPENSLMGTLWTVNCCSSAITVPASMKGLRFWRNTRIASLPVNGVATLSPESLGYEWDEDVDNGFRPHGLIRMSHSTREGMEKILDFGTRVGIATATHSLTLYKHQSGALVFGAGTVQWSWGLDSEHDRGEPGAHVPDQAMQQATVNLFGDMDVHPATLQIGADPLRALVRGEKTVDVSAPLTTIASPSAGSVAHSGGRVTVRGTATDVSGAVAGVEVSVDGGGTWRPAQGAAEWSFEWKVGALGLTNIRARAIDDSGNLEIAGPGIMVSVEPGACPCSNLFPGDPVPAASHFDDLSPLELGVKFRSDIDGFITGVRFYKSPANTGAHIGSLWTVTGTRLATATFAAESASGWQQVSFDAPVPIVANTVYIASYHSPNGRYTASGEYFTNSGVDSPPLHALGSAEAGGNGVFVTGGNLFPNRSFNATNYWVDVVFSPTSDDQTAPVISDVRETTIDAANAVITWTTNEAATSRVEYSTSSTFPVGNTLSASVSGFATTHRVALGNLSRNTTYFYRVISSDRTGNTSTKDDAPSFTLPGPTLRDTAQADFAAGQTTQTYAAQTADGELMLAPTAAAEFSGPGLPTGWLAVPWTTGGAATAAGGVLTVDAARVGTCTDLGGTCASEAGVYGPGRSLEFVARFGGDAFQHAGFGVSLTTVAEPWAIFSTFDGAGLYARTNTGAAITDVFLGAGYLTSAHRFRIDWHVDGTVEYFIDGTRVAGGPAVTGLMRPVAASDFSVLPGTVAVDWMRMTPFASTGTFLSRVFDAEGPATWRSVQWTASTPAGTSIAISVRAGDTTLPGSGWSAFVPVTSGGALTLQGRYVQYRAELSSSDPAVSPTLDDIIVSTSHAPAAQNDAVSVVENASLLIPAAGPGSLTANDLDADSGSDLRVSSLGPASHGIAVLLADGSVRYTPATNYRGDDAFTYVVSDGMLTGRATVFVTVREQNVAPVAAADAFAMNEDAVLTVSAANGLLANDTDAEQDPLQVILVAPPAHGTLALGADGAFTYTPERNYAGNDAFAYKVTDGSLESNVAAVQIAIAQVNDAPIAEPDTYAMLRGEVLTVPARGVLINDHDVEVEDTAPLSASVVGPPAHGSLALNSNGGFVYTPDADFVGVDRFTYAAVDHFGAAGAAATVTINVQIASVAANTAAGGTVTTGTTVSLTEPLQTSVTTPSAASVTITNGVLANNNLQGNFTFLNRQVNIAITNAADGSEFSAPVTSPLVLSFTIDPSLIAPDESAATLRIFRNGVVVQNCLGATEITSVQLDPCITRRETAANGSVGIVLLTTHASEWNMGIDSVSPSPVAQDDGPFFTKKNTPVAITAPGVLGNDYARAPVTAVAQPFKHGGNVTLGAGGGFVFTPDLGFCGRANFSYLATAGVLKSGLATAEIDVNCDPVAAADGYTILEDSGATTLTVLQNDSDPEDQLVRITAVTSGAHGTVTMGGDGGWVTYKPEAQFFGLDTFTYTISDGRGGSATGTVTMTVADVNDRPSFTKGPDQMPRTGTGPQSISGWATNLSAGPANEAAQSLEFVVTTTNAAHFDVPPAVSPDGTLTFTPAALGCGVATVTVSLRDSGGTANGGIDTSAPQAFSINLNCNPIVAADTYGALEDAAIATLTVLENDSDADGQIVRITSVTSAAHGAVAIAIDGRSVTYKPEADFFGADTFTYTILDDRGGSASGTVTVNVVGVNDRPSFTKGPDQMPLSGTGAQSISGWATALSAGPANEAAQTFQFVVTTTNQALFAVPPAISPNGTLTFTPAATGCGIATVTVSLRDSGGTANGGIDTSTAQTFSINLNCNPIVTADTYPALEDAATATLTVLGNDSDSDGQVVRITSVTPAAHGAVAVAADGRSVTYKPEADFFGADSFTYAILDDRGGSASGTVTVNVAAVNDRPSFTKGPDQMPRTGTGPQSMTGWATNLSAGPANEAAQTFQFVVSTTNQALFAVQPAISPNGTLAFTPAATGCGIATVTVSLRDSGGTANGGIDTSAPQTFSINLNCNPVATADTYDALEDGAIATLTVLANDSDSDGQVVRITSVTPAAHGTAAVAADGQSVTYKPEADFFGADTFTYTILDDRGGSASGTVTVNVAAVNDRPSFTKGADQLVSAGAGPQSIGGWATNLSAGAANEAGQTFQFVVSTTNAALFSVAPAVSPSGTLTFTPATTGCGIANVTIALKDNGGTANGGVDTSASQTFAINLNCNPVATADTYDALEDAAIATLTVLGNDSDPDGQVERITSVTSAAHGAVAVAADGKSVTYKPEADFFGADTFTYTILDDRGGSATGTVTMNVAAMNDRPSFVKGADQFSSAGAGPRSIGGWATALSAGPANEATQSLQFAVISTTNAALFSVAPAVSPDGTLTFTPAATGCGIANVTVSLRDSGGTANGGIDTSASQTFAITLNCNPIATADTYDALEDAATATLTVLGNDSDSDGQIVRITSVTPAAHGAIVIAADGKSVTYKPEADFFGADTFTYTILDDRGGTATGSVTVNVAAVNDRPSFTKGADQLSTAGAGPQSIGGWATNLSAGPANEAGQTFQFVVSTTNTTLFAVQPAISPNGTLTFTPAASGGGAAVVTVALRDSGGTANGGIDTSAAQTFTIALPFPTTTTLSSPTANPTSYGQNVALNASVTSGGGGGTPQGTVDFLDGANVLGSATLTNGTATLTTGAISAGTSRIVTAVYRPAPGFLTSQGTLSRTVTAIATTTTASITLSVQYSDLATFETTVTGSPAGAPAQSASFRIGTQVIGTAPLVWDGSVYRAKLIAPMVESSYTPGPTGGPLKPASKTVAITYDNVSPNYTVTNRSGSMQITREDAVVSYAGDTSVTCSTCSAVPVQLRAMVAGNDAWAGDLRNATVTFINRTTGATIATVPVNADGTANFTWTVNLGTATTQTTKIGMAVGGYYLRNNTLDDGSVTIRKQ